MTHVETEFVPPRRLAIIGIGLLGGSIGLAARRAWPSIHVTGVARREETRRAAHAIGSAQQVTAEIGPAVCDADLVVLCTPVDRIAGQAQSVLQSCPETTRLTDVGSTKARIIAQLAANPAAAKRFVGSHPMAGGEKTGPAHARADLFVNRRVIVTPNAFNADADVIWVERFWQELGATTCRMSPAAHDQAVAATSHLPHLVAALLARGVQPESEPLIGQGWLDTTRIAAGDPELWMQIVEHNRDAIAGQMRAFAGDATALGEAIERGDFARVHRLLDAAARRRNQISDPQ